MQLVLAMVLGGLVGLERELKRKAAGLRTFAMVSLGACLFSIISVYGFGFIGKDFAGYDPSRIVSQIVVGVGFLGGGAIFLKGDDVSGMTTAAGIWISAAIGTAVGLGMPGIAVFTTFISIFILAILRRFETYLKKHHIKDG